MRELRKELQLIFQDPYSSLNPRMTLGQIIGEGLLSMEFRKRRSGNEGIHHEGNGGVWIIRLFLQPLPASVFRRSETENRYCESFALRPRFVVCDEAVSALYVSSCIQILNLLQDLEGKRKT